jgi:hypothetical protein
MKQAALIALLGAAVAASVVSVSRPVTAASETVTFSEQVAPIIFNNCTTCHRPGENAPFALMNYADARPRGARIAAVVKSRQMPPWKADPSDFAFHGDRRLTDADIATIDRWVAAGMPEGDPSKLPKMPAFTDGWQLGTPDLVVKMPEAYDVPASGRDIYRNFVLPLNLDQDVWVKAVDFRPAARSVVHHALFFLDQSGAARQQDDRDPGPGYNGGMGGGLTLGAGGRLGLAARRGSAASADADNASGRGAGRGAGGFGALAGRATNAGTTLGGWAPGAQPRMLPDDLAYFVPKGSDLIISTHFHPSGKAASEASTVGLYFARRPPSKAFTAIQLPPVFGFLSNINIPAGEPHYTVADSFVTPVAVRAFGVVGHAHYLAKTMKMTATLPNGDVKTLLSISDWDFGWQEQYQFADYVDLPKGTRLDVTVGYDNSAANKRNPSNPPQAVRWGEQSTDEMGSISLLVVSAERGELPQLQQAMAGHLREKAVGSPMGRLLIGMSQGARR